MVVGLVFLCLINYSHSMCLLEGFVEGEYESLYFESVSVLSEGSHEPSIIGTEICAPP